MIYAVIKENDIETAYLFCSWEEYFNATFSPVIETLYVTKFKIGGKTYNERKNNLEHLAVEWSLNQAPGLSYGELGAIENFFLRNGRKYGLLNIFRENAIC